ncbi:MAG: hypothetical protein LBT97_07350, partial [Planctomycetota bacterium]|nr:hypothetical protein [Planctomycetota bacterium]
NSHDQDVTVNLKNVKDGNLVPADYWTHPQYYQHSPDEFASFHAVKRAVENNFKRIVMYRAVPKNVKEIAVRNGDWITPSLAYAKGEGAGIPGGYRIQRNSVDLEHVWWDGNSINEFGYDDGKEYAYKNTTNNRKLTDAVVRDLDGNMVPPSKRFNMRAVNIFYQSQAADGPENNRGSITFPRFAGGATVIHLFQNADVSTVIHELNHGKWTPRKLLRESNGGLLDSLKKSTKSPLEGNPEFVNLALKPAEGPICKNHDPGGAKLIPNPKAGSRDSVPPNRAG